MDLHCAPVQTDVRQTPEAPPRRPLPEFTTRMISVVTNVLENRPDRAMEDQMENALSPLVSGALEAASLAQVIS